MHDLGLESLIFRAHSSARYSLAALIGAIEIDQRLTDLNVIAPLELTDKIIQKSIAKGQVMIAHSVMSTQINRVRQEIHELRDKFGSSILLVAGGPHASAKPSELLEIGFDFVIIGEGEHALPELLSRLMNSKRVDGIQGLISEYQETYPSPKSLPRIELDDFPPFALDMNIVGPIEVTRGCPFACKFCCTPFLTGGVVRHRSVHSVTHWLRLAVQKRGFKRTWFLSPNALCYGGHGRNPEPEKLENLLREAKAIEGLEEIFYGSFPSEVRPEFVNKPILEMMRQYVANKTLQIGVQSGSNRILKSINRHHTVEEGIESVRVALDCGFVPHVDMIFGFPNEKKDDVNASLKLCNKIVEMGGKIHNHVFMPLPGSAYENMPPGVLSNESRKILGDLARRKKLTGAWSNQEKLAEQLSKS